jgi:integrase
VCRVPGCTDKAAELERDAAREQSGLIDRFAEHRRRPLSEHLGDWHRALVAKNTREHADKQLARARKVVVGCRFRVWGDLSASAVEAYLADLRSRPEKGISVRTSNYYLQATKGFVRWMVRDGRAPESPLAHLQGGNAKKDPRRERRAFTDEEMCRLSTVTQSGPVLYGLAGWVRAMLYQLVVETGLRQKEARLLNQEAFDLVGAPPTVTVRAAYAKGGRDDEPPLLAMTADSLRPLVMATEAGSQVFALPEDRRQVIRMFRKDLEAAGIPYIDAAGRYGDFHALRHTFITNLVLCHGLILG